MSVEAQVTEKVTELLETLAPASEKVTEFLGTLAPALDSSHASSEAQPSVTEQVTEFLSSSQASSMATTFSSLTNGVSTLFEGKTTPPKERKGDEVEPLASALRRRGGAVAEDGYEQFFEYRSEPQKEATPEKCKTESDSKEAESITRKKEGSKNKNSLAAVLRRRGGSLEEQDGFEAFFEYKKEGTPKDREVVEESPWQGQIRRNLKKPQSFHLPENDIEVDSPRKESSDSSRFGNFAQLQSLWESRTPYAGAKLNESMRISKTEAQSALHRLSMKGFFSPGDLDEVRKLRQALLDADGDVEELSSPDDQPTL
jgi:hypothetical protein